MRAMMTKTQTLTALFVMAMGVVMILPSNLAIASPADGGGSTDGGSDQDQEEPTEPEVTEEPEVPTEELIDPCLEDPNAIGCGSTEPVDPCLANPSAPECQPDRPRYRAGPTSGRKMTYDLLD